MKKKNYYMYGIIAIIVILYIGAIYLFITTLQLSSIDQNIFYLTEHQINILLLLSICQIILFELLSRNIVQKELINFLIYPKLRNTYKTKLIKLLWYFFIIILVIFGTLIPLLDLIGSIPLSLNNIENTIPKISLMLITSIYIFYVIDRRISIIKDLKYLFNNIGRINVLNREKDHRYMSEMLDRIKPKSSIYVTHFEEPINPIKGEKNHNAYYYEDKFMKKWFSTIKKKKLNVTQIVLINSDNDIVALKKRINVTKDIPTYNIAYILAPPMTIYVDFLLVPNDFVLIAFSDSRSMKNMNVFSLLIRGGDALYRFDKLFNDILLPEAKYVKTFEGIREKEILELELKTNKISRSSLKIVKELFDFQKKNVKIGENNGKKN